MLSWRTGPSCLTAVKKDARHAGKEPGTYLFLDRQVGKLGELGLSRGGRLLHGAARRHLLRQLGFELVLRLDQSILLVGFALRRA